VSAIYETDQLLAEYLLFHFGTAAEILPPHQAWPAGMTDALDFAVRTPSYFSEHLVERALDLGCAVGRSAFEMTRTCGEVVGIDFSHAFIGAAEALRKGESVAYDRREEAALVTRLSAAVEVPNPACKLIFQQGDAMDLPADLGHFDRVHAANLLCRLPAPERLLRRLPDLVKPGGELVLATPCTWLETFTPRENWPSGTTLDWLKSQLGADFSFVREAEEPFLIRETARKFQWTRSLVSVWQRKA
jgi:putative 4-mercaptohistidine N1-methyltranferase